MYLSNTVITAVVLLNYLITYVQAETCNVCGYTNGVPNQIREEKKDFILGFSGLTCQDRENEAAGLDASNPYCRSYYHNCRWQEHCCDLPCRICCGTQTDEIPPEKENNLVFTTNPENNKTCSMVQDEANHFINSGFCGMFQTDFYQEKCCNLLPPPPSTPPPTYPDCDICGSDEMEASNSKTGVQYQFFGEVHTCEEVYDLGLNGGIAPEMCTSFKTTHQSIENCCIPKTGEIIDVCEERTCTDDVNSCCDGWTCDWRTKDIETGIMKCTQSEANYKKTLLKRSCKGRGGSRCKIGNGRRLNGHRYLRGGLKKNSPDVIYVTNTEK